MAFSPERKAVLTAASTAAALVVGKGVVGVATGSMAVLASAADSLLDLAVSVANFFAVRYSERPADRDHNYGHGKAEGLGALLEGVVIMAVGLSIGIAAVEKILLGRFVADTGAPLLVMAASFAVTFVLVAYLRRVSRATGSLILEADALHYKTDLLSNAGIFVSLLAVRLFDVPVVDPAVSVLVAGYIAWGAVGVMKAGLGMLMDAAIEPGHVEAVEKIIGALPLVAGHHFLKTRRSGRDRFVEAHLVFKDPLLPLFEAHRVAEGAEAAIKAAIPGATVTLHLDPGEDSAGEQCRIPNGK